MLMKLPVVLNSYTASEWMLVTKEMKALWKSYMFSSTVQASRGQSVWRLNWSPWVNYIIQSCLYMKLLYMQYKTNKMFFKSFQVGESMPSPTGCGVQRSRISVIFLVISIASPSWSSGFFIVSFKINQDTYQCPWILWTPVANEQNPRKDSQKPEAFEEQHRWCLRLLVGISSGHNLWSFQS